MTTDKSETPYRASSTFAAFLICEGLECSGCESRGDKELPFFFFRPAARAEELANCFNRGAPVIGKEYAKSLGLLLHLTQQQGFAQSWFHAFKKTNCQPSGER